MYKIGDSLMAKRTVPMTGLNSPILYFTKKDKWYKITKIDKSRIYVESEYDKYHEVWEMFISRYFYTTVELRKIKLEKLRND
jgi:hypothetical protein